MPSPGLISVIVPTYERKGTVGRALASVLAQTDGDFEVVVVDDGSTDGTGEYVRSAFPDPRIRLFRLEKNSGVHAARNRGIDEARGKFLLFLDSDDDLFPECLATLRRILDARPEFGVATAPLRVNETDELTGFDRSEPGEIPFGDVLCDRRLRARKAGTILLRREAVGAHRFVMQNLDFIFYRYVLRDARQFYWPEPLGTYRLSDADAGSLHAVRRLPNADLSIRRARAIDAFLDDFLPEYGRACPAKAAPHAYGAAVGLLLAGERARARGRLRLSMRYGGDLKKTGLLALSLLPFGPALLRAAFQAARAFRLRRKKTA